MGMPFFFFFLMVGVVTHFLSFTHIGKHTHTHTQTLNMMLAFFEWEARSTFTLLNGTAVTCSETLRHKRSLCLALNGPTADALLHVLLGFYIFMSSQSTVPLLGFTCEVSAIENN